MRIRLLLAAAAISASLMGQSAAPAATASLSGVALLSTTGQPTPVRRARVNVRKDDGTVRATDTDTLGQFRVDQLAAGKYRVVVEKPGFVPIGHEPVVELRDGQAAKATVMMRRGSAIEGRIVNPDGEPAMGLTVSAVRLGFGPYGKKVIATRQTVTDDLGRFRLHTLSAGEFYIEATPDPLRSVPPMPGNPPRPTRTYYPGTGRLNEARVVALAAEAQMSDISFTMGGATLSTIAGNVVAASGGVPAAFTIRIQRVGAPPGEVRCLLVGYPKDSTFSCPNVPPGDFWMLALARATADSVVEFGTARVTVDGHDLRNLSVKTTPGVRVTGRLEAAGGTALLPGVQVMALDTEFEYPGSSVTFPGAPAPPVAPGADGTFSFPSLAGPRLFRVQRLPEDWAIASVSVDGKDIADTPTTFAASEPAPVLRILLTSQTGSIQGSVVDAARRPAAGATVVIFVDDERRWGARSRFIRTAEVDSAGRYLVRGLLPGQYRAAFVDLLDDGAWEDPDVLARLKPLSAPIAITAGQRATLDGRVR